MLKGRNIGRMDIMLTIEQPVRLRNSINEDEISWILYTKVFAERIWNASGDKFEGKQETGVDNAQFNARYYPSVNSTMRLKQGIETSYFYITNVRSSPREGLMILNAERRDNMDETNSMLDLTGMVIFKGYWDPSGGTLPGTGNEGWLYKASANGTVSGFDIAQGAWILFLTDDPGQTLSNYDIR